MSRLSGEGIVYSAMDVKIWASRVPGVEAVRPGCCSQCGAPSRPLGAPLVLIGHGLRERQVRGPATAQGDPELRTIRVRRYRCRRCGGLTTVLPRGLTARRHYSASAIGLSLCLFGMQQLSVGQTRARVCPWRLAFEPQRWTTLSKWVAAVQQGKLFAVVRPCPPTFAVRDRAERAAATLCSLALRAGSLDEQVFEGAALAA
ncbi:MAG: hypothetical protein RL033_6911 [Pseudomonadota bacterium]|jgi:hypothetical protein